MNNIPLFFGLCVLLGVALGLVSAWFAVTMYNAGYKAGKRDSYRDGWNTGYEEHKRDMESKQQ